MDPSVLKEEGNQHFKNGNFDEALSCYTRALEISELKDADKAIILKNRSACHLKQEHYQSAADDASACKYYNMFVFDVNWGNGVYIHIDILSLGSTSRQSVQE